MGSFVVLLGMWMAFPEGPWALPAVGTAAAAVALAARSGWSLVVSASVVGLAASAAAVHTTWRVGRIENHWEAVHRDMVDRASLRLEATLGDAVAIAEALAERGLDLQYEGRDSASFRLEAGLAARSPERGVVVFDESGRPWAWAGEMRTAAQPSGVALRVRMTRFYTVLEAERARGGRRAVSQVLLAADSAVPNRANTVAARFARGTGAELEFLAPRDTASGDAFPYCVPECNSVEVYPDTLFRVRAAPPSQGDLKLAALERGGRRVAVATVVTLGLVFVAAAPAARFVATMAMAVLLLFTPMGSRLWLEPLFSPRSFYLPSFGPLAASAGDVLVLSALIIVVATGARHRVRWRIPALQIVTAGVAFLMPFAALYLSRGVAPPDGDVSLPIWLSWTASTGVASTMFLMVGALAARASGARLLGPWAAWGAGAWTVVVSLIGVLAWHPAAAWPWAVVVVWMPAAWIAMQPAAWGRTLLASTTVATGATLLFVWGAVVNAHRVGSERDVGRLADRSDPVAQSTLETFGTVLRLSPPPASAADLYALWRRSALSRDDYPASLTVWSPDGDELARLDLAALELPQRMIQATAMSGLVEEPVIDVFTLVPGAHFVLAVPYPDGRVVSVAVGPRSRVIEPIRVAQFLRGQRRESGPYELTVSDRIVGGPSDGRMGWRRADGAVIGERVLPFVEGPRQVRVRIELAGTADLLVRGVLLVGFAAGIVLAIWAAAEFVRGTPLVDRGAVGRWLRGESYRTRLTVALAVFFFVPTVAFALWSVSRLRAEVSSSRDLVIRQTLQDAAGAQLDFAVIGDRSRARVDELANQLDAEFLLYEGGQLFHASTRVLAELGLVDPYLPPNVLRRIVLGDGPDREVTVDRDIAGRRTRVGYINLRPGEDRSLVLASPRLVDDARLTHDQIDIFYALLVVILAGFAAASGLAHVAGGALATPVQALSDAAAAVGRGERVTPFAPDMPAEFVPVVEAFAQMASDVASHQDALAKALMFTEAVLHNVATGVAALGADLRITTANQSAVRLLGVEPSPYEPVDAQTEPEWSEVWTWVRAFLAKGYASDATEFTVGDRRIRAQVVSLEGNEGGCVLAFDDATDLAQAERILAWGEMARQVAHEIKNPLTPIRLGVQHLQRAHRDRRGDFDATLDKTARQILAEIERLDAIARAFSRFGAPPAEAQPLNVVDLGEVVRETASLYSMAEGTTVNVTSPNGAMGRVRKDELKEVIINVVENARNAGATEVGIEIDAAPPERATVVVRDNGRGIPADDLGHIFEPQFSTTTSGTGLGLAICKRLVESWGGTISAESEPGRGTAIIIEVPT